MFKKIKSGKVIFFVFFSSLEHRQQRQRRWVTIFYMCIKKLKIKKYFFNTKKNVFNELTNQTTKKYSLIIPKLLNVFFYKNKFFSMVV